MDPKETLNNSTTLQEINEETPEHELLDILAQKSSISFCTGGFRRDYPEHYTNWDYETFGIVIDTPEKDTNEGLLITTNKNASVYDNRSENYSGRGFLLVIEQNYDKDTLIYSQGLEENTIYLENDALSLTQEEGTTQINSKLQKAYDALNKAKAYTLLMNSQLQKTRIGNHNFNFASNKGYEIDISTLDHILGTIKDLLSTDSCRRDVINKSSLRYKD